MSQAPLYSSGGAHYDLPWKFFRRRFIVLMEVIVAPLAVLLVLGAHPLNLLILCFQALGMGFVTYAYVGTAAFVRSVTLDGSTLRYAYRRTQRTLDLNRVNRFSVTDDGFLAARLYLYEGPKQPPHAIPLLGEAGQKILDHVLAHVPESAKPKAEESRLKPYKPGLFRPREEPLPLPEAR